MEYVDDDWSLPEPTQFEKDLQWHLLMSKNERPKDPSWKDPPIPRIVQGGLCNQK